MKRLAPQNKEYITEYANYLYSTGRKKKAKALLKSLMPNLNSLEKAEIKKLIQGYK